jgi:hypothetical protein
MYSALNKKTKAMQVTINKKANPERLASKQDYE